MRRGGAQRRGGVLAPPLMSGVARSAGVVWFSRLDHLPRSVSIHHQPAVRVDELARDVARTRPAQEADHIGDLAWLALPAHGDALGVRGNRAPGRASRIHTAGRHAVHAHIAIGELARLDRLVAREQSLRPHDDRNVDHLAVERKRAAPLLLCLVVGSWYGTQTVPLDLGGRFHRNRIRLFSSQVSTIAPVLTGRWDKRRRLAVAWETLARLQPERLGSRFFPLSACAEAFEAVSARPEGVMQVGFRY